MQARALLLPASLVLLAASLAASSCVATPPGASNSSSEAAHLGRSAVASNDASGSAMLLAECTSFSVSEQLTWPWLQPLLWRAADTPCVVGRPSMPLCRSLHLQRLWTWRACPW